MVVRCWCEALGTGHVHPVYHHGEKSSTQSERSRQPCLLPSFPAFSDLPALHRRDRLFRYDADPKRLQFLGVDPCDLPVAEPDRLGQWKPVMRPGHVGGPDEAGARRRAVGLDAPGNPVISGCGRGDGHRLAMELNGAARERVGVDVDGFPGAVDAVEFTLDPVERKQIWARIYEIYAKNLPVLPLYYRSNPFIIPKWLKGIEPTGNTSTTTL